MAEITHAGIIKGIEKNKVLVAIQAESACVSCQAKEICGTDSGNEKVVEVESEDKTYKIGDKVIISLKEKLGFTALFYAYVLPFIILIISLIISLQTISSEGISAVISLVLVIVYYFILYMFKDKLKKKFHFKITENFI
ncbi:MAG: hypothetical protein Kow0068_23820 [Marinilabiliales bacterium]